MNSQFTKLRLINWFLICQTNKKVLCLLFTIVLGKLLFKIQFVNSLINYANMN